MTKQNNLVIETFPVIEQMSAIFLVGTRDFIRLWLHTHGSRTHACTHARTQAQVLAQANRPTFLRGVSRGGWNSLSAVKLRIKCAQVMLPALLVPGGSENQRPLPPKTEPNRTAASLIHFSLRYFWKRIYCKSFSYSQISVRGGWGWGAQGAGCVPIH